MIEILGQIKKTVVFLGKANQKGEIKFYATGFLVQINNIIHLVTAKHVVFDGKTGNFLDSGMLIQFNLKTGKFGSRSIDEIKRNYAVNWIFHKDKNVDVAIIPFHIDPHKDDIRTIPDTMFLDTERLFELYDVFFLSYQPGIESQNKILPIIRTGTLSIMNDDKTFYIDAFAFPGNSGSPVFLKPSPIRFDQGNISIGVDPLGGSFIGVLGEYLPYQEVAKSAQTGRPRVVFEENTGLARIWSVTFIKQIIESTDFQDQLKKLKK